MRPKVHVSSVVIDRLSKALLVVKYEKEWGKGTYSLPGGALEYGERVWQGQVREVLEETGYKVTPYKSSKLVGQAKIPNFLSEFEKGVRSL